MSRQWNKVLVVDLESTCWEAAPPFGQVSDVIEIGLCVWDSATGAISQPLSYYVKPKRSSVSAFCYDLTGITHKQANGGLDFDHACRLLRENFGSRNKMWAAFGDDADTFRRQCRDLDVAYPFGNSYLDVSGLYSLMKGDRLGLRDVMKNMSLEFEGRPHCGRDDAYNTARVLRQLLRGKI